MWWRMWYCLWMRQGGQGLVGGRGWQRLAGGRSGDSPGPALGLALRLALRLGLGLAPAPAPTSMVSTTMVGIEGWVPNGKAAFVVPLEQLPHVSHRGTFYGQRLRPGSGPGRRTRTTTTNRCAARGGVWLPRGALLTGGRLGGGVLPAGELARGVLPGGRLAGVLPTVFIIRMINTS